MLDHALRINDYMLLYYKELRLGETPHSIELPRAAASELLSDFERSAGSTVTFDRTLPTHEGEMLL